MMAVYREMTHHGTESFLYMYAQDRKYRDGKRKGGGEVQDNRGMGMAEILMVLAVLIILTLVFRKQLAGLAAWFCSSLYC